jgi:hypothetical protein
VISWLRPHLTYANVMVTLIAIAVFGGGAAAIGDVTDEQGRIQACYVKTGPDKGQVRLLVKGKCTRQEKAISWNEEGPAGAPGQPGAAGAQGAAGSPDSGTDILGKLAGVDGSGSGLDADRLDNLSSSDFAATGHNHDSTYVNEGQPNSITPGMVAAPEPFREVGGAGQPPFLHSCHNIGGASETVAFYKDNQGLVHLKGVYNGCSPALDSVFQLPAGYRPASGKVLEFFGATAVTIYGPGLGFDGHVFCGSATCGLNGITFRAAS